MPKTNNFNLFDIKGSPVESKYIGCGHAFAAFDENGLIDLIYFQDVFDDYDLSAEYSDNDIKAFLKRPKAGEIGKQLNAKGEVLFGMCSCYQFIVL